jgi:muramoyltetrapeptide carboxypeptidase
MNPSEPVTQPKAYSLKPKALRRPAALRPGDAIAVIAPAGPPDGEALARGIALLRGRYDVRTARELPGPTWGVHAGPDDERGRELLWALTDPDVRCVIAARGGYGTARLLEPAVVAALARAPRLVVGFSDVTALLAAALRAAGLRSIHGPMVCQLGRRGKAWPCFERLVAMLEDAAPRPPVGGLAPLVPGVARGPLVGGNLTVLSHLVGTPFMPSLEGAVLFIEDVGERPYRLDRCLTHLRQAGALDGVAGVVVGDLTDCEPAGGEHAAIEVVGRCCAALGVPVATGLQAGHGQGNEPLPLGAPVELDATAGRLTFFEGVVAA